MEQVFGDDDATSMIFSLKEVLNAPKDSLKKAQTGRISDNQFKFRICMLYCFLANIHVKSHSVRECGMGEGNLEHTNNSPSLRFGFVTLPII